MKTIVIDIGGTSIKIWNADGTMISPLSLGHDAHRDALSSVAEVNEAVIKKWPFDRLLR